MHQTLHIPEILLNIFGHCSPGPGTVTSPPAESLHERCSHNADLAVLARVCNAFKEPALDVLWEELDDISPLARCLPDASRLSNGAKASLRYWRKPCYSFSRPLKEVEWNTLRSYACRVRMIRGWATDFGCLLEDTIREIFYLAPFADPLFPLLRSLCWHEVAAFAPLHVAVPSLIVLQFNLAYIHRLPIPTEFIDAFGDNCPDIEEFTVRIEGSGLVNSAISRQICRWTKLQQVSCQNVGLSADAILHLSSTTDLKQLSFTAESNTVQDISHLGSVLIFPSLERLVFESESLDTVTSLLTRFRLPAIERLSAVISNYISKRSMQAFWAVAYEVCPHAVSIYLGMFMFDGPGQDLHSGLMLEDLRPLTAFSALRVISVSVDWHVCLTDADLLELVSPRTEELTVNYVMGWGTGINGGGITLSGLVQILRKCPSLNDLCTAIDTRTFTEILEGLDVSFPPRKGLEFNFVDSYIKPEFVPGMVSVFTALGVDSSMIRVWEIYDGDLMGGRRAIPLWDKVLDQLKVSGDQPLPSE